MKKLAIVATFAVLTAVPASAQSSAPEFGSGNVPAYSQGRMNHTMSYGRGAFGAYAQVNPGTRHMKGAKRRHHLDAY